MKCLEPQNCWMAEAAWIKRKVKDKYFLSSSDHFSKAGKKTASRRKM